MSIPPFGYILILWIIYSVYKGKKTQKIFYRLLVTELFFSLSRMNYGYFIKISGIEIEYNDVLLGCLFILSMAMFLKNSKIPRKSGRLSLFLLLSIIISIFMCIIWPASVEVIDFHHSWDAYLRGDASQMHLVSYSSQSLMMFFRVMIFVVILNIAYKYFDREDWISILKRLIPFAKIVVVYGVIELILKFGLGINITPWMSQFFGRGISTGARLTRLSGISREASYYALALFNFLILFLSDYYIESEVKRKRANIIWITIIIVIGAASTSFSFVIVALSFLFILLYLKNFNYRKKFLIILAVFAVVAVLCVYLFLDEFLSIAASSNINILNRIAESITAIQTALSGSLLSGQPTSEMARLGGGIYTFNAALARPVFGLGIGTAYTTMGIICIFANVGIVGLALWLKLLFGEYGGKMTVPLMVCLLLPPFFCNDLYTLYDTSYLLLIPIIQIVVRKIGNEREEDHSLCINKY